MTNDKKLGLLISPAYKIIQNGLLKILSSSELKYDVSKLVAPGKQQYYQK